MQPPPGPRPYDRVVRQRPDADMSPHDEPHPARHNAQLVVDSRPCPSCGYDLRGLFVGGNCPECGRIIGITRTRQESHLINAPKPYLLTMLAGFVLMSAASFLVLSLWIASVWWRPATPLEVAVVNFGVVGVWLAGVLLVLRSRPDQIRSPEDRARLELVPLRSSILVTQCFLAAFAVFDYIDLAHGWPAAWWIALASMAVGILGFVPLCYYLAIVAEWKRDESMAARFRNLGWLLAFFALALLVLRAMSLTPHPALLMIGRFQWMAVIGIVICVPVVLVSVAQMAWGFHWLLLNARASEERDRRQAEKAAREAQVHAQRAAAVISSFAPDPAPSLADDPRRGPPPVPFAPTEQPPDDRPQSAGPLVRHANEQVIPKTSDAPYGLADE